LHSTAYGKPTRASEMNPLPVSHLDDVNILRLPAFRSFYNIKLDRLAFLQCAESVALDGCVMNEYVVAVGTANKPKALGIIEPFHCSLLHDHSFTRWFVAELRVELFASRAGEQNRQERQVGFDDYSL
jgi:hypothetical protein